MTRLIDWTLLSILWTLLSFFSAVRTWNCSQFNSTQKVIRGLSTTISCYGKQQSGLNKRGVYTVKLRNKQLLCAYIYLNQSWTKQLCKDYIRLVWIPETAQISLDLLNIQISNSGIYTCTTEEHFPPPTQCVSIQKTFIHVIAYPSVSLSCVKGPDGVPTLVCAAEGFYPADLKQAWLRDGEYISYLNTSLTSLYQEDLNASDVSWTYSKNTVGAYSVTSYLHLSSNVTVYYCWVNHSTLRQPITVNISSTECTEGEIQFTGLVVHCMVVWILFGLLTGTAMFMEFYYQHQISAAPHLRSSADAITSLDEANTSTTRKQF